MVSMSRRYVVVFNGEIYNFQEIKEELQAFGHRFTTTSDTEVILAAVEQWDVEQAIQRFVGMFAIALWDTEELQLHLVRDRLGIKPLYYGWIGEDFAFASECSALAVHPDWKPALSDAAMTAYLRYGYVPTPFSIYTSVFKLPAGCILSFRLYDNQSRHEHDPYPAERSKPFAPKQYWSLKQAMLVGQNSPFRGSFQDAVNEADYRIRESVRCRLVSDVPVGAFLSGGIDSAVVVTMMHDCSPHTVNTFTIGMDGHTYDEAPRAARLAKALGTNHTEHRVSTSELLSIIPTLGAVYDEPFADSSQIPTYAVCRAARAHVTVALSGDGGDEVFAGYNRYIFTQRLLDRFRWVPLSIRRRLARYLRSSRWDMIGQVLKMFEPLMPRALHNRWLGINVPRIADVLSASDTIDAYTLLNYICNDPTAFLQRPVRERSLLEACLSNGKIGPDVKRMIYLDLIGYHSDDILAKVDRASMAFGLEVRVPLIDHRVIEFAATLPIDYQIAKDRGKLILRNLLRNRVPSYEIDDNKRGFSVPLAQWLRGPLRDWAAELLSPQGLARHSFFRSTAVANIWQKHLTGKWDFAYQLWTILMFQAFWDAHVKPQKDHVPTPRSVDSEPVPSCIDDH
jgi:asparagine synthase (glutamine-hydrolysing)